LVGSRGTRPSTELDSESLRVVRSSRSRRISRRLLRSARLWVSTVGHDRFWLVAGDLRPPRRGPGGRGAACLGTPRRRSRRQCRSIPAQAVGRWGCRVEVGASRTAKRCAITYEAASSESLGDGGARRWNQQRIGMDWPKTAAVLRRSGSYPLRNPPGRSPRRSYRPRAPSVCESATAGTSARSSEAERAVS
jgi:hypothetical protein